MILLSHCQLSVCGRPAVKVGTSDLATLNLFKYPGEQIVREIGIVVKNVQKRFHEAR